MREVQGYPLPLGVQISKDRVNFSIAVPADKDCQLLLYRTGRKKPCRQFDMKPMIGEVEKELFAKWNQAKADKDFDTADKYRNELAEKGLL